MSPSEANKWNEWKVDFEVEVAFTTSARPHENEHVAEYEERIAEHEYQRLVEEHTLEFGVRLLGSADEATRLDARIVDAIHGHGLHLLADVIQVGHVDEHDEQESRQRAHEHRGKRLDVLVQMHVGHLKAPRHRNIAAEAEADAAQICSLNFGEEERRRVYQNREEADECEAHAHK